ncbi:MAG TPA: hypothetical protein PK191_08915 [Niabella sp.]|nr:hypothetical protein [Niabella sp.]HOZ98181.1 hypothetical protein [Niabella sp.]HQW16077.1 hypothetical protein [Niabella sp.]HQX21289.1 hypothetical protein [Niabella sp.]HQX41954.1 hypothetical protein [Niabella sp.]
MKVNNLIALVLTLLVFTTISEAQIKTKQEKGYFNITNIAEPYYLQSIDSSSVTNGLAYVKSFGVAFSTINGLFLNPSLSIGLGIGYQGSRYNAFLGANTPDSLKTSSYFDKKHSLSVLPIFADFRYYPKNHRNDIVLILDVGYAPVIKIGNVIDKAFLDGGPFIKLGAGYKIEMSESVSFLPTINFNAQRFGDNTAIGGNVGIGLMF